MGLKRLEKAAGLSTQKRMESFFTVKSIGRGKGHAVKSKKAPKSRRGTKASKSEGKTQCKAGTENKAMSKAGKKSIITAQRKPATAKKGNGNKKIKRGHKAQECVDAPSMESPEENEGTIPVDPGADDLFKIVF